MPSVTLGLRTCSPARPRHPASLPICVPSVERLPPALSRRLLAETTWRFGYGWRHKPPSGTFHPDRPNPCRAHERRFPNLLYRRHPCRQTVELLSIRTAQVWKPAIRQTGKSALVCPAGVWSRGMKGSRRGLVTPTVAEPPGRLRKEPARKGGRQTFDRRNTNGQ